jgi:four helix bundle protein
LLIFAAHFLINCIMQNFKELKVWQKSHLMVLKIYENTRLFPKEELYGLTSQLRRSAISVPANLAEGCGKDSRADVANYFQVALGSLHETEYYILLSKDLLYVADEKYKELDEKVQEVKAMLIALIKSVRNSKL